MDLSSKRREQIKVSESVVESPRKVRKVSNVWSCVCQGRLISLWSLPPEVCNRIFQIAAGRLWDIFFSWMLTGKGLRHPKHWPVTKHFSQQNSNAISDISNKIIVIFISGKPCKYVMTSIVTYFGQLLIGSPLLPVLLFGPEWYWDQVQTQLGHTAINHLAGTRLLAQDYTFWSASESFRGYKGLLSDD